MGLGRNSGSTVNNAHVFNNMSDWAAPFCVDGGALGGVGAAVEGSSGATSGCPDFFAPPDNFACMPWRGVGSRLLAKGGEGGKGRSEVRFLCKLRGYIRFFALLS
jgi:hypothetical protein